MHRAPEPARDLLADAAVALSALGRVDDVAQLGARGALHASLGEDSLFNCIFGRDALRMAFDLLDDAPDLARATILDLIRVQGTRTDPESEEEPGRIAHEYRPPAIRFGSVDATPLWIALVCAYCRADPAFLSQVAGAFAAAVRWLVRRLHGPVPRLLWSQRATVSGMINQSWADSYDAFYFDDGTLFDPDQPRVAIDVQGYAYDALVLAAELIERLPQPTALRSLRADDLRREANALRTRVLDTFWRPDLGTFALGASVQRHGTLRLANVVASNPGHLLASRLLDGPDAAEQRATLIERLLQPDMLAGGGIRTKSTRAARFHPGAYHNGSTWPMDTGVIADGLRRHGCGSEASMLEARILAACAEVGGFPEFVRGDPDGSIAVNTSIRDIVDEHDRPNRLEQPPQAMQGWTVTRVWRIIRRTRPGTPLLPKAPSSSQR